MVLILIIMILHLVTQCLWCLSRIRIRRFWIRPDPSRIQTFWIRLDPDLNRIPSFWIRPDPDPQNLPDIRPDPDLDPVHPYFILNVFAQCRSWISSMPRIMFSLHGVKNWTDFWVISLLSCINQYKYRKGLLPMQYVFLIRSSAGGKKYIKMLMNTCMQYNHTIRICIALLWRHGIVYCITY